MDTRTVYRYENDKGEGPYRANYGLVRPQWVQDMGDSHAGSHHPTWTYQVVEYDPGEDYYTWGPEEIPYGYEEGEANSSYIAACASRKALDTWFDGWQDQLEANGFHVVEYTVPAENVVDGRSGLQCAFLPVAT